MCRLSDKLKLCTCGTEVHKLKNYWVFHRFTKGQFINVVGEVMLPAYTDPSDHAYNKQLLPKLLNEGNIFDVELRPKNRDRLQLSFATTQANLDYGFEFRAGKWKEIEFDFLTWMWRHNAEESGKIIHATAPRKEWGKNPQHLF